MWWWEKKPKTCVVEHPKTCVVVGKEIPQRVWWWERKSHNSVVVGEEITQTVWRCEKHPKTCGVVGEEIPQQCGGGRGNHPNRVAVRETPQNVCGGGRGNPKNWVAVRETPQNVCGGGRGNPTTVWWWGKKSPKPCGGDKKHKQCVGNRKNKNSGKTHLVHTFIAVQNLQNHSLRPSMTASAKVLFCTHLPGKPGVLPLCLPAIAFRTAICMRLTTIRHRDQQGKRCKRNDVGPHHTTRRHKHRQGKHKPTQTDRSHCFVVSHGAAGKMPASRNSISQVPQDTRNSIVDSAQKLYGNHMSLHSGPWNGPVALKREPRCTRCGRVPLRRCSCATRSHQQFLGSKMAGAM